MTTDERRMTNDDLSPELRVLLCCARTELDAATAERLASLLTQPLDWPGLIKLANRHGVMPLLYRALNEHGAALVPATVLAGLQAQYQANARRNVVLTRELLRLLALLEQHSIPAIPYKGPALAMAAYGDLALRQFGDLDILVRPEDTNRAKALLEAEGYQLVYRLNAEETRHYAADAQNNHFQFQHPARPVCVELHWATAPRAFFTGPTPDVFWQALTTTPLADRPLAAFLPEHTVLLLSMHGSKHGWERLAFLADLVETLRRQSELDWATILTLAHQWRCTRMLALGLHLGQRLLGLEFPAPVRQLTDQSTLKPLAQQAMAYIIAPESFEPMWRRVWFQLQLQERWPDRLSFALAILTAPTVIEWRRYALPSSLAWGYGLLRPLRLVGKYTRRMIKFTFEQPTG